MKIKTLNRIFIICFACIFILFLYSEGFFSKKPKPLPPAQRNIHLFNKVTQIVKENYVDRIDDPGNKFDSAYTRMLSTLDKNSTYLNIRNSEIFELFNENTACSCGIYGYRLSNFFYITDVLPGSPADKKGLKTGFFISSINKEKISRHSFWQIFLSLHSKQPEEIKLRVFKESSKKARDVILTSEPILNACQITPAGKRILVIKLPRFDKTGAIFLGKNRKLLAGKDLVLDLRNYSGGDFTSFSEIAGFFLKSSNQLSLQSKGSSSSFKVTGARKKGQLIIVIDRSTIMYSELLAALLKSAGGKVIGAETKGMAGELKQFFLEDRSSILLTTGFYLWNGVRISGAPVKPDLTVKRKDFKNIIKTAINQVKK